MLSLGTFIGGATELSGSTLDSLRKVIDELDRQLASDRQFEADILTKLDLAEQKFSAQSKLARGQRALVKSLTDSVANIESEVKIREQRLATIGLEVLEVETVRQNFATSTARTLLLANRLNTWSSLEFLFGADSWRTLMERRSVLNRLAITQQSLLHSVSSTATRLQHSEDQLVNERLQLDQQREHLATLRRDAQQFQSELERDARMLSFGKSNLKNQLSTVQSNRDLLESRKSEVEAAQKAIGELIARVERGEPLGGAPLHLLKGFLSWPVIGKVVQRFGPHKNRRLDTVTENPGIDIGANPDAAVMAVADGRISSVTWLRGFGNVCIVEHPGDYFSVYAKLGEVTRRAGENVTAGQNIGFPGFDPTTEDYRVHFELWSGKTKLDPQQWLDPH